MKKRTVVIAVVVLIGITACVTGVLIHSEAQKRARYEQAMRLADAGDTGGAYALFAQLGNYRDAASQAERLIEQDVLLPYRAAEKGDTVTFGRFEQDNNPGNGPEPIDWIVLDKVDGKLLLLSSACLAGKAYNAESFAPVTWETCSLRAWLGGEFFDSAFSEREREAVASVVNRNDDHSTVGTPGGKDTEDRVFLLSESDAVIYLNNDYDQDTIGRAMASDYAVANGLQTDEDGLCSWWLRSPGMYEYIAQFVDQQGKPYPNGGSTDIDYLFGVRPALWVDLDTADEGAAAQ